MLDDNVLVRFMAAQREDRHDSDQGAARLFIAAMVQPTHAMLVGARDWSYAKYGKPIGNDAATGCWQAMIAALLDELV